MQYANDAKRIRRIKNECPRNETLDRSKFNRILVAGGCKVQEVVEPMSLGA